MSVNPTIIPVVIIPLTFLFILLIVLTNKSPKAGAWLIGGLVFAVPILLYRVFAVGPAPGIGPAALPLLIIPVTFLFILLVVLTTKAPKAGAGLIVALVVMGVFGLFFGLSASHQPTAIVSQPRRQPPAAPQMTSPAPVAPAPIWSEAVEGQFEADVYPSELAAVRAIGLRMDRMIREWVKDINTPHLILFQEGRDPGLLAGLKDAIQQALPQLPCGIEVETRNIRPNEIGVELHFHKLDMQPAPWGQSPEAKTSNGQVEVRAFTTREQASSQKGYLDKPWAEDFAAFAGTRPQQHFIIARSLGTCTTESEANQQALDDARARLTEALGKQRDWTSGRLPRPEITTTDVLRGGFIVDRFAQSFEGSVGKIWRQALLLDVSGVRLAQLASQKAQEFRQVKMSWARTGLSAVGVIVLIGVIYFFLNMATMGYYEWSLRIAGVVLAIVAVISILMVVR